MPTRGRTVAGILLGFSFTLGQLILAGVAYVIRPWRRLQFAVSTPFLVFFLYSWYVLSTVSGGGWACEASLTCPSGRRGLCSDGAMGCPVGTRLRGSSAQISYLSAGLQSIECFYLHQLPGASQQPRSIL